jgi:hypothetical protein
MVTKVFFTQNTGFMQDEQQLYSRKFHTMIVNKAKCVGKS